MLSDKIPSFSRKSTTISTTSIKIPDEKNSESCLEDSNMEHSKAIHLYQKNRPVHSSEITFTLPTTVVPNAESVLNSHLGASVRKINELQAKVEHLATQKCNGNDFTVVECLKAIQSKVDSIVTNQGYTLRAEDVESLLEVKSIEREAKVRQV